MLLDNTSFALDRIARLLEDQLTRQEEPTTFPLTAADDSITVNRIFPSDALTAWKRISGEGGERTMVDITFIHKAINAIEDLGVEKLTKDNITVYKVGDNTIRIDIKKV